MSDSDERGLSDVDSAGDAGDTGDADNADNADNAGNADGDDLFGDEDDDALEPQILAEEELASNAEVDDADANDGRLPYSQSQQQDDPMQELKEKVIMGVTLYRHRIPKPQDKIIRTLRIPQFLKVVPDEYDPSIFEPTQFDMDNARSQQYKHTIRFSGKTPNQMRSNTVVYRWADGSVTLSVGEEHYEMQTKPLATSPDKPYNEVADVHCYAAAAELGSNMLMMIGHIGEQYSVRPPQGVADDAQIKLQEGMAAAMKTKGSGMSFKLRGNPELDREKAEQAEKERIRAEKRRETAQARALEAGLGRSARSGLGVTDLEAGGGGGGGGGGRRGAGGKKRGMAGAGKPRKRRPDYDSDDDLPQGSRRQEAYDLEDEFIAPSDEESAGGADDDEDDEDLLDDDEESVPRPKRQRTAEPEPDDDDVEGDDDDRGPAVTEGRGRRRRVIDDEDDE